jgi:hypothetical protein
LDRDAIKGQAIAAISAFNVGQTHSTDEIAYVSPINMTVVDENTVVFETVRERALISRRLGGVFEVVGRQMKLPT